MMMMMYSNNDRQLICDVLAVKNTPVSGKRRAFPEYEPEKDKCPVSQHGHVFPD